VEIPTEELIRPLAVEQHLDPFTVCGCHDGVLSIDRSSAVGLALGTEHGKHRRQERVPSWRAMHEADPRLAGHDLGEG
jgi:hypothetical protein